MLQEIKNPVLRTMLFVVDNRFEISNLELLKELKEVIDLATYI
jgi:hypothetical protein